MCTHTDREREKECKGLERGAGEEKERENTRKRERVVNRLNQHKRWRTNKKKTVIYLLKHKATSVAGEGRQTH